MSKSGGERRVQLEPGIEVRGSGPFRAIVANPRLDAAQERATTFSSRFLASGPEVLDELLQEVATMPIAPSFNPSRQIKENLLRGHKTTHEEEVEPDVKRRQLRSDLASIRNEMGLLAARLADVVMDIE